MVSTVRLCEGLGLSRHRLEQWISRGELEPQSAAEAGKGRDWGMADAMRALITYQLWESGMNLPVAGAAERPLVTALRNLRGIKGGRAFLVLRPVFPGGPIRKVIVSAAQLTDAVAGDDYPLSPALVIDLDRVEEKVRAALPEIKRTHEV